ncbi:MAG: PLP-dependent aspartate aminotransferase family protein [Alphaproteobacteria bacterium]|jgi:cystathionine gamma-synthase|nr:PLP-dependent aspartate aminotransferase family protein [Alphaproteobacteria bacterium]
MARDIDKSLKPATLSAQALGWLDPSTRAVAPPIYPSTNYARDENYEKFKNRGYTRDENPTYEQLEALLAALEKGAGAMVFGSGMAAATTVMMALSPGDHVVAPSIMYFGLRNWLVNVGCRWGLKVDFVPPGDPVALANAVQKDKTKLVWIETPANPSWEVTDIAASAQIAHDVGAILGVDSTVSTPVLTNPITLGADIVMHSGTKYLNGHGDLLAGALVTAQRDELWERMNYLRFENGGMLGAFEAWLLLRGMRTLHLRVERASQSALRIAEHFEGHALVREVLYPGLSAHEGHEIAVRQMTGGFGGMLSLRVKGGAATAIETAKALELFVSATSLGGVESLVEHRATAEGPDSPVPDDLLRLSVGVEDAGDLIADLERALAAST